MAFNPFGKKKSRESSRERSDKGGDDPDHSITTSSPTIRERDLPHPLDQPPLNPDYPSQPLFMIEREGGARRKTFTDRPLPKAPPKGASAPIPTGVYPTQELQDLTILEERTQDQYYEDRRRKEGKKERQRLRDRERESRREKEREYFTSSDSNSGDYYEADYYEADFYDVLEKPVTHKIKYFIKGFFEDEGDYKYLLNDESTVAAHEMTKPLMDRIVTRLEGKKVEKNPTPFEKTQQVMKNLTQKWRDIQMMQRRRETWNQRKAKKNANKDVKDSDSRDSRFSPAEKVSQHQRPIRSQKSESWSPVKTPGKPSKGQMDRDRERPSGGTHQATIDLIHQFNKEMERNRQETEELRAQVQRVLEVFQEKRKPEKTRDTRTGKKPIKKAYGNNKKDSARKPKKEIPSDGSNNSSRDSRSASEDPEGSEDGQELEVNTLLDKRRRANQPDTARLEITDPEDFEETFWARIQKDSPPAKSVKLHNHFDILAKNNIVKVFERIGSNYAGNGNIIARLEETARAFIGLGISRECFVRFFAEQLLTSKEKERVSIALKDITTIKELIASLKQFILSGDGSVREEQSANRWIREAFGKDADISAISTECMVRAKKIVASQSDFSTVTHEIVADRTESKARQLLLGGISNYAKEDILDRIVESGAFNESTLQGLTRKVLPFFQPKLRRAARNHNLYVAPGLDEAEEEERGLQKPSLEHTMNSFMDKMDRRVKEVQEAQGPRGNPSRNLDHEEPSQELEVIYTLVNNLMNQRSRRYPNNITPTTICYECDILGDHTAFDCPTKPKTAKGMMICYNCGDSGHTRTTCSKKRPTFSSTTRTACNLCKAKGLTTEECKQRPLHCFYHEGQPYPCPLCRPKN